MDKEPTKIDEFTMRATRDRMRRNREAAAATGDLSLLKGDKDPHYHIVYNDYPYLKHRFDTEQGVLHAIFRLGTKGGENTVWYESGQVQIETPLHGRTGLHRVMLTAAMCYKNCSRVVKIEDMKRLGWVD